MITVQVWTGREAAALRQALRLSVRDFAARLGVGTRTVSNWVSGGETVQPRPEMQAILDSALAQASEAAQHRFAQLMGQHGEAVRDTDRRQVLAAGLGTAGMLVSDRIGAEEAKNDQLLLGVTAAYRRLERRASSRSLIEPVASHLRFVTRLTGATATTNLHMVASETAGLAAWLHADMDETANARRHYALAVRHAVRSGHWLLPAYMQASAGQFEAQGGDPVEGLRLVREARHSVPGNAPAIATVWLDTIEAIALAERSDQQALTTLANAERKLDRALDKEAVWPWLFRFDHAKLACYRALVNAKLRRPIAAKADLAQAKGQSPKLRALMDVAYAGALASDGAVDEACAVASGALAVAMSYSSDRVLRSVAQLRTRLATRKSAAVTALDESVRAALREVV